ncbi:MAG: glycosyl hydrolase family 18 protein [bacterium]|nr:glycosyl hydrolase family 18 protein [bacterium]
MKWVVITILLLVIAAFWNVFSSSENSEVSQSDSNQKEERTHQFTESVNTTSSSIFIPYWKIPQSSDDLSEYDRLIYFGVAPDSSGIMIQDSGFKNIDSFVESTKENQEKILTIRMLDDEVSLSILDDTQAQKRLIAESIDLAQEYQFDGIVLDLELGVIPFEDVETSVTNFVERFSDAVYDGSVPTSRDRPDNTRTMTFSMTMYGDVFYRARPYDLAALSDHLDHIYIMAYDFHKSRGEPGPNFPYEEAPLLTKEGNQRGGYDYSFQKMIADFSSYIDPEQITIVFGMYGYDWTLGKQGLPLKSAKAIPLNEIETGYSDCRISVIPDLIRNPEKVTGSPIGVGDDKCVISIDTTSKEKKIKYVDQEGYDHILWYEDEESSNVKIDYLMEQGIGSVGYWVWGYFD